MSSYKVILFDLDGTLSDPKLGITKSVQYALSMLNRQVPDLDDLECFIGPPLHVSFADFYGFDEETIQKGIHFYRERYKDIGMYENLLYPEMPGLLQKLKDQGCILAIATSKWTAFAEKIAEYFNISSYFDVIVGSNQDGTRSEKTEIIEYILELYKDFSLQDFIMVGDRKYDLIGANNTGIDSVAVTYGYGAREELSACSPTFLANSVQDLERIMLGETPSHVVSYEEANVLIRQVTKNDLYPLWEMAYKEERPEWKKWDAPYYEHQAISWEDFQKQKDKYLYQDDFWAIETDGKLIGTVSYYWEHKPSNWLEMGIVLYDPKFWSGGYGTKALKLWINYLFQTLPLVRVGFTTWSGNRRMMKVGEKLGMQLEARLRKCRFYNGVYYDSIRMGLLREEWEKNKRQLDNTVIN